MLADRLLKRGEHDPDAVIDILAGEGQPVEVRTPTPEEGLEASPSNMAKAPDTEAAEVALQEATTRKPADFSTVESQTEKINREIMIGDKVYETDLPEGIDPIGSPDAQGLEAEVFLQRAMLIPQALDKIPEGEFVIKDRGSNSERKIIATATPDGMSINIDAFYGASINLHTGDAHILMGKLGYAIKHVVIDGFDYGYRIVGVPTPETIKKAAAKLGVKIKLLTGRRGEVEKGKLEYSDYLQAFAEGQYPVSVGEIGYYGHDIQDDHLSSMVLGGDPLKKALREAASSALKSRDEGKMKSATANIDRFTAALRRTLNENPEEPDFQLNEAYSSGRELGISDETIGNIMQTVRSKAKEFGMTVVERQLTQA